MSQPESVSGAASPNPARPGTEARFHRFRIGEIECIALSDGGMPMPRPPHIPAPPGTPDTIVIPLACLLVRLSGDGKWVLMDSGFGESPQARERFGPGAVGKLQASLAAAGVQSEEIDAVLLSHLDPDHVGGLFTENGAKSFPNATYHANEEDVQYWSREDLDLSFSPSPEPIKKERMLASKRTLASAGSELKTFRAGDEVLPGIRSMALPGHTLHQVGFVLSSGGETLLYTGDAIANSVISVETPDVHNVMDIDPVLGVKTRRTLLDMLSEGSWHSFTPHFPWPNHGKVQKQDGRTVWKSAEAK